MRTAKNRETGEEKEVRCGTCTFFCPHNGAQQGQCRLNPPTPVFIGMQRGIDLKQVMPQFIPVLVTMDALTDWCGQWAPGNPYPTHQPEQEAPASPAPPSKIALP